MSIQAIAAAMSFVGIAAMVLVFSFVLSRSGRETDYAEIQPRAYGVRKRLFFALLIGFFIVPALTLRKLPYSPELTNANVVDVTAHQWYWTLSEQEFVKNQPVVFRVTSQDVNHGFGIYDESNRLIAQVQAMPGYVSELAVQFDHAGAYKIMCLEYCGLVHHGMIAAINVLESIPKKESI